MFLFERLIKSQIFINRSIFFYRSIKSILYSYHYHHHYSVRKSTKQGNEYFNYICTKFPELIIEKIKSDILDGPQIRKLINDQEFPSSMS